MVFKKTCFVQKQNGLFIPTSTPSLASGFVNTTRLWGALSTMSHISRHSSCPWTPGQLQGKWLPYQCLTHEGEAGWSLLSLRLCSWSNLLVEMARKSHCHYWWERELFITEKTMFDTWRYRFLFLCQPFYPDLHGSNYSESWGSGAGVRHREPLCWSLHVLLA